jgi:hypothetical protein
MIFRSAILCASLGILALAPASAVRAEAASAADAAAPTRNAVWVERELTLVYMGFTNYYSCEGLRSKLRFVLDEIGARPGYEIRATGCINVTGPERMPGARVVAALPVEATPAVLARLEDEAAERALIARATGKADAASDAATAQFPARTRLVEFRGRSTGRLDDGDCELMEQVRDRILVPLGARVVEDGLRCSPRSVSPGSLRLTVEVLEPVPAQ